MRKPNRHVTSRIIRIPLFSLLDLCKERSLLISSIKAAKENGMGQMTSFCLFPGQNGVASSHRMISTTRSKWRCYTVATQACFTAPVSRSLYLQADVQPPKLESRQRNDQRQRLIRQLR